MPGPGFYRDAEIRRDTLTLEIDSAAAETITVAAAAVGKRVIVTKVFLTFQGTDQVSFDGGADKTGPMQFKVDGILDLPDAWIVGDLGSAMTFIKAQAVAARGYVNFIYR